MDYIGENFSFSFYPTFSYTLLEHKDLEQFLGCRFIITPTPINEQHKVYGNHVLVPLPLPRSLNKLASKTRLHRWLSHLLLCTLSNAMPRPPSQRIDLPNNLHPFFRLLVHLHDVGFPAHWLGEFLQNVVSDTLVTDMKPCEGLLPISPARNQATCSARKVHLKAWQLELEIILATVGPALPFHVILPKTFSTFEDVHTYRAHVDEINLKLHQRYYYLGLIASPFIKAVGLIFYRPNPSFSADDVAKGVPGMLEGNPVFADVQIVLGANKIDLSESTVEWRMSKRWYEKMKSEKWKVAAYRTDLRISGKFSPFPLYLHLLNISSNSN